MPAGRRRDARRRCRPAFRRDRTGARSSWPAAWSHGRPDLPGGELRVAIAESLGLGLFTRSDRENFVEDLLALVSDRDAVDHVAAIDVHVLDHPAVGLVVGGELDRGRRLAAISRAAAGGETDDVGAAGD